MAEKTGSRAWVQGVMERVFEECRALRAAGQKEYAHQEDNAFANFESDTEEMGVPRESSLLIFANKHWRGIRAWARGHRSQRENVRGRINDLIVYLVLLRGMIEQDEAGLPVAAASIALAGVCNGQEGEHSSCATVWRPPERTPHVCECECRVCKRAWFDAGRPIVTPKGRVVTERGSLEEPAPAPVAASSWPASGQCSGKGGPGAVLPHATCATVFFDDPGNPTHVCACPCSECRTAWKRRQEPEIIGGEVRTNATRHAETFKPKIVPLEEIPVRKPAPPVTVLAPARCQVEGCDNQHPVDGADWTDWCFHGDHQTCKAGGGEINYPTKRKCRCTVCKH